MAYHVAGGGLGWMPPWVIDEISNNLCMICNSRVNRVKFEMNNDCVYFQMETGDVFAFSRHEPHYEILRRIQEQMMMRSMQQYAYAPSLGSGRGVTVSSWNGTTTVSQGNPTFTCKSCGETGLSNKHELDFRNECEKTREKFNVKVKKLYQHRMSKDKKLATL